jgi:hypothetical protein
MSTIDYNEMTDVVHAIVDGIPYLESVTILYTYQNRDKEWFFNLNLN